MKALVTGASAGIGRAFAGWLADDGYDLIITARREDRLQEMKESLRTDVTAIRADLSKREECLDLFRQVENEDIRIVINNAGFGVFGEFDKTDLDAELDMLQVNVDALHILTKLFLKKFKEKNEGYILNVASSAGFFPGPLFSSYYASKAYVVRLTQAIAEELRRDGSNVYAGVLCPGPVATEFNAVANARGAGIGGLDAVDVARYALDKMYAKKTMIVPGAVMKIAHSIGRLLPDKLQARMVYNLQSRKK